MRECEKIGEAWMTGAERERTPDKAGPHPRGTANAAEIFHSLAFATKPICEK